MRLIDADKIRYEHHEKIGLGIDYGINENSYYDIAYKTQIDKMPTIEPERKNGKWEIVSQHENPPTYIYRCSECQHKSFGFYNYCPNCGARMECQTDTPED